MTDTEYQQARLAVALVMFLVAALAVPPVAAQTGGGDTLVTDLFDDEDDDISAQANDMLSFVRGWIGGVIADIRVDAGDDWSAEAVASDLRADVAGNATAYQTWLNDRLDASDEREVLKVRIENESSTATLFVTSDAVNGTFTNVTAVRSTDRVVGETCTLSGDAGRNAYDELVTFREQFVEPNETLTKRFTGRLAGQYREDVECTFLS